MRVDEVRADVRSSARARHRLLLTSCALASALAAAPAHAGAFNGTVAQQLGATVNRAVPNVDTVTVTSSNAYVRWTPNAGQEADFLPTTGVANYVGTSNFTILNEVTSASAAIGLNGKVNATINGQRGGNVWFYNPGGIVVGANAAFSVGSLLLSANAINFQTLEDGYGVPNGVNLFPTGPNTIEFLGSPAGVPTGLVPTVRIQPAAIGNTQIVADDGTGTSYVTLAAPRIVQGGRVQVNGSANYLSFSSGQLVINNGLFDFILDAESGTISGVGATGGSLEHSATGVTQLIGTGAEGAAHTVRMVALPSLTPNEVVTMLVNGRIETATGATVSNGRIELYAGFAPTDQGTAQVAGNPVSLGIGGGNLLLPVSGLASGDTTVGNGAGGSVTFGSTLDLVSLGALDFAATGGTVITAQGNVDLLQFDDAGGITIEADAAGALQVAGNLTATSIFDSLTADPSGGAVSFTVAGTSGLTPTARIDGDLTLNTSSYESGSSTIGVRQGGTSEIVGTGGSLSVGGDLLLDASAAPTTSSSTAAQGGTASVDLAGGSLSVTGSTTIDASAESDGGDALGGMASIKAGGGGIITLAGTTVDASATASGEDGYGAGAIATGGAAMVSASGAGSQLHFTGLLTGDASGTGSDGSDQGGLGTGGSTISEEGGDIPGGALMLASGGGAISLDSGARLMARGTGGDSDSIGGDGQGGLASITVDGGTLTAGGAVTVDAQGFGGSPVFGGAGGVGTGGTAQVIAANGNAAGGRTAQFSAGLTIDASGTGGGYDETGYGGSGFIAGGDGIGGTAQLFGDGGGILGVSGGLTTVNAIGNGGAGSRGSNGGNGTGGRADVATNRAGGTGATLTLAGLRVAADGIGGTAENGYGVSGAGGTGGTGIGGGGVIGESFGANGVAPAADSGAYVRALGGTISATTANVTADGSGGDGSGGGAYYSGVSFVPGEDGFDGGAGGDGVGGTAQMLANGGTLAMSGVSLTLSAQGFGGDAGSGGQGAFASGEGEDPGGIGGAGGNGGKAHGGAATLEARGGTATFANVSLDSDAASGNAGSGGDGETVGSAGNRGSSAAGAVAVNTADAGSAKGSLALGGASLTATADIGGSIAIDAESTAPGGSITASYLTAYNDGASDADSGFSLTASGGPIVIDNYAYIIGAGDATFTLSGAGALQAGSVYVYRGDGGITVSQTSPTAGLSAISADNDITLLANTGITATGATITAGGDLDAETDGAITGGNFVATTGDVDLFATGAIDIASAIAGDSVTAESDEGGVSITTATAGTDPNFETGYGASFAGAIGVLAAGDITIGTGTAYDSIGLLSTGGSIDATTLIAGNGSGSGSIAALAAGTVDLGTVTAPDLLYVGGPDAVSLSDSEEPLASQIIAQLSEADNTTPTGGDVTIGSATAGAARIYSGGIIDVTDSLVTTSGDASLGALGDITVASLHSAAAVDAESSEGAVDLEDLIAPDGVTAIGTAVTLAAPGDLDVDYAYAFDGDVGITALGDLSIDAAYANGNISGRAQGNLTVGDAIASGAGSQVYLAGGYPFEGDGGAYLLTGSTTINGRVSSDNFTHIDGGGNVTVAQGARVESGNLIEIHSGDDIVIDGTVGAAAENGYGISSFETGYGSVGAPAQTVLIDAGLLRFGDANLAENGASTLTVNGSVLGNQIGLTSEDIAVAANAVIGDSATGGVEFFNSSTGPAYVGDNSGATEGAYLLDAAELARAQGAGITVATDRATREGYDGPDMVIGDLALRGENGLGDGERANLIGYAGSAAFLSDGSIQVVGAMRFDNLGADNGVLLAGVQSVRGVLPDASISLSDGQGTLAGQLVIAADQIAFTSQSAADAIANATSLRQKSDILGRNDGPIDEDGYIRADGVTFVVGESVFNQNSGQSGGAPDTRAGITVGDGGITLLPFISGDRVAAAVSTQEAPLSGPSEGGIQVVLNGRQTGEGGSFTGAALIPEIRFGSQQAAFNYDPESTVNGCLISGRCGGPGVIVPPIQDVLKEITLVTSQVPDPFDFLFQTPLISLADFSPFTLQPLIDTPVTGSGNEDLWAGIGYGRDADEHKKKRP